MKIIKVNEIDYSCNECHGEIRDGFIIKIGCMEIKLCDCCYHELVKEIKVQEYREELEEEL